MSASTALAALPGTRGECPTTGQDTFTALSGVDGTAALAYAEAMGLRSRTCDLVQLD